MIKSTYTYSIHNCIIADFSRETMFQKGMRKESWTDPFCFVTGNLWEELKDDSLAVDPLVLISSSPSSSQCFPSHCQMENGGSSNINMQNGTPHSNLPDLQLTTLYSAFMELDTVSPAYLSNSGSKPIALMWTTRLVIIIFVQMQPEPSHTHNLCQLQVLKPWPSE